MSNLDPTLLNADQLVALGPHALHHLALRAAGTLTSYRLLLGHCILAIQRSDMHLEHDCSSAIHYATRVLGMKGKEARLLRHVASRLEELPGLAQLAARGEIEWSKLREVVRVASPETEAAWIELCAQRTYAQIERLVSMTSYGMLPGEAAPGRRTSDFSEVSFCLSAEARVIVERGLQSMSQEAGKMLDMAEAVEFLFAEFLARRPLDEQGLEKARQEAQLDLAAEEVRDQALCPVRDNSEWLATVGAREEECGELQLVAREKPHWKNPLARVPSPGRRRELLRRDGYCCSTPGCPNHLYLETHHIVFYSRQGQTVPDNLVVLCASCHRNVHRGHLRIEGRAPDGLRFLDREGRDLERQHRLDVAHWLDIWLGWRGREWDSHYGRARAA